MKPTIKVSIGALAFILDNDAYEYLENYLNKLRNHFRSNEESEEILRDIEQRLSELLQMRLSNLDEVASLEDIEAVTQIMGSPKDFGIDEDADENQEELPPKYEGIKKSLKKKIYRDMDQRILGGVCSGLGNYFRIDPVIIRVVWVALFFIFAFWLGEGVPFTILAYVMLWAIMPKAVTFEDKLRMKGGNPSIENIEDRSQASPKIYRGSGLVEALVVFFKIFLGIIGFALAMVLLALVVALVVYLFFGSYLEMDLMPLILGMDDATLAIAGFLAGILPLILSLWAIVKVIFNTKTSKHIVPVVLLGFIIWLIASIYVGVRIAEVVIDMQTNVHEIETIDINTKSDTLWIDLDKEYYDADFPSNTDSNEILFRGYRNIREAAFVPIVNVSEDSTLTEYKVEFHKYTNGRNTIKARERSSDMKINFSINDSILSLSPEWYSKDYNWRGDKYTIQVICPPNKSVKLGQILSDRSSKIHDYVERRTERAIRKAERKAAKAERKAERAKRKIKRALDKLD